MPKVYVVCKPTTLLGDNKVPKMNLKPAAQFGELVYLLEDSQSLYSTVPTVRLLKELLYDFTDEDYLLPVGDPVLMRTVAMIASEYNHGRVKFLKWDKFERKYYSIQVDTSGRAV